MVAQLEIIIDLPFGFPINNIISLFNSVNEIWRSFFGVTPSRIGVRPLEDAALARLRLVFAFKTVVVGSKKCNWVKWLQWGDEEVEVVGVQGMEEREARFKLAGWGNRAKEGVEAEGAGDMRGSELGDK